MPKRSPHGAQPYVEAFPSLDALAIERAVRADRLLSEWMDEAGRVVGHVRVIAWGVDRLDFEQRFGDVGAMLPSSGRRAIEIVREHRIRSHDRPSFICKACGEQVGKLFLVWDEWNCRKCHKLCYISQRAAPIVRILRQHEHTRRRLDTQPDSFETPRDRKVAQREFGELEKAVVNSHDYEIPRPVSAILFGEWMSLARRPGLVWDEPSSEAGGGNVKVAVPARPAAASLLVAPYWGSREEDGAEEYAPHISRFSPGF